MELKYNFDRLAKGVVSEEKPNYSVIMEHKLFRTNNEIQDLINNLEKKSDEAKAQ
jgi:hypothetical protein